MPWGNCVSTLACAGGVHAQYVMLRSLWARLRCWLACLTSVTNSHTVQMTVEDGRRLRRSSWLLISWAVSENRLAMCWVGIESRDGFHKLQSSTKVCSNVLGVWWELFPRTWPFLRGLWALMWLCLAKAVSIFFTCFAFICDLVFISILLIMYRGTLLQFTLVFVFSWEKKLTLLPWVLALY